MKRILLYALTVIAMIGCSQDPTVDDEIIIGGADDNATGYEGGVFLMASIEDATRVIVDGDIEIQTTSFVWEEGDRLTISYAGTNYQYMSRESGEVCRFIPINEKNAINEFDPSESVAVYYNVRSVDLSTKVATFDIAAEQIEGEASNKVPLYAYKAKAVVNSEGRLEVAMKPLASVFEFVIKSSKDWHATSLSIERSARAGISGYTSAEGLAVDPATGEVGTVEATLSQDAVRVSFDERNFNPEANVQVVMGAAKFGGTRTYGTDQTTIPGYGVVLKLYKNGAENFRRTIWASEAKLVDVTDIPTYVHQPLKDIMTGHVDGISTADDMLTFAKSVNESTETFPAGAGFCNENGEVVLNNSINLGDGWNPIGHVTEHNGVSTIFAGIFNGNGNTITYSTTHTTSSFPITWVNETGGTSKANNNGVGLFAVLGGNSVVKNLTVAGSIVSDFSTSAWTYAGGLTAQIFGGTINNCTNNVTFSVGANSYVHVRAGGIVGRVAAMNGDVTVTNCTNTAALTISPTTAAPGRESVLGGLIGIFADGAAGCNLNISNLTNKGTITMTNNGANQIIGGVIGFSNKKEENLATFTSLKNEGEVVVGNTQFKDTTTGGYVYAGGIVGYLRYHSLKNCSTTAASSVEYVGDFAPSDSDAVSRSGSNIIIGGIAGQICDLTHPTAMTITGCENRGAVSVPSTLNQSPFIGGIAGQAIGTTGTLKISGCDNYGKIKGDNTSGAVRMGGIVGNGGDSTNATVDALVLDGCNNYGEIELSTSNGGWSYAGGIVGSFYAGNGVGDGVVGGTIQNCNNSAIVRDTSKAKGKYRIGGIAGMTNQAHVLNCDNSGAVAVDRAVNITSNGAGNSSLYAGIVGQVEDKPNTLVQGCDNSGTICATAKTSTTKGIGKWVVLAGIVGNGGGANTTIDDCDNTGDLLIYSEAMYDPMEPTHSAQVRGAIGGLDVGTTIKNCGVGGNLGLIDAVYPEYTGKDLTQINNVNWVSWVLSGNKTKTTFSTGKGNHSMVTGVDASTMGFHPELCNNKIVGHRGGTMGKRWQEKPSNASDTWWDDYVEKNDQYQYQNKYYYPDNSFVGMQYCIDLNIYAAECDIYWTGKDDDVVVAHAGDNDTIHPYNTGNWTHSGGLTPWNHTIKQIKDLGTLRNSGGETIHSLGEYIDYLKAHSYCTKLWIDIKKLTNSSLSESNKVAYVKNGVKRAIEIIKEKNAQEYCEFICSGVTDIMTAVEPLITAAGMKVAWMNTDASKYKTYGYKWANITTDYIYKSGAAQGGTIEEFLDAGLEISVYNVDSSADIKYYGNYLHQLKAVCTNYPYRLKSQGGYNIH